MHSSPHRFLRVIRMHSMCIVTAQKKAGCSCPAEIIFPFSKGPVDPFQDICQERGCSTLFGPGSHFLVVKARKDIDASRIFPFQESFQRCIGALKVIQLRAGKELFLQPQIEGFILLYKKRSIPRICSGLICNFSAISFLTVSGSSSLADNRGSISS